MKNIDFIRAIDVDPAKAIKEILRRASDAPELEVKCEKYKAALEHVALIVELGCAVDARFKQEQLLLALKIITKVLKSEA